MFCGHGKFLNRSNKTFDLRRFEESYCFAVSPTHDFAIFLPIRGPDSSGSVQALFFRSPSR